jgi:hypothetical protein
MALAMTTAAGIGAAAATAAAVPNTDGTIAACRNATTGELRIIDPAAGQTCQSRLELPLTWNQRGEPGPQGPVGPPGPAGPQGPGFTKTVEVATSAKIAPGQARTVDVACPAGTIVTGGGFSPLAVDSIAEDLVVLESLPLKAGNGTVQDRYRVRAKNGSTISLELFVIGLCAK